METVFRYTLQNAWSGIQNEVKVIAGPSPCVQYSLNREGFNMTYGLLPEENEIGIGGDVLERICRVLEDERLFEAEELEPPYNVSVLDGFSQEFEISTNGRHVMAWGNNIRECKGDEEHCPHSVLMIRTLEKLKKILMPAGVPKECFRLDL